MTDPDELVHRLAAESDDDPTGWFERLYVASTEDASVVPWDRDAPQPLLVAWAQASGVAGGGRRALVVGCGLGADAEYVAGLQTRYGLSVNEAALKQALGPERDQPETE